MIRKKKLLIMMYHMKTGGVEQALLNFLSVLDKNKYDVTLLFVNLQGEYMIRIPNWINIHEAVIPAFERCVLDKGIKKTFFNSIKNKNFSYLCKSILLIVKRKISSKVISNAYDLFESLGENIPPLEEYYDVALDFHGYSSFTTYYVSEKVTATKKATWLHSSDFNQSIKKFIYYYNKYDRVYGVSKACVNKFIEILPEFTNKCEVFYNILLNDEIIAKAENGLGFEEKFSGVKILTVGRLAYAKGYDVAILVAKRLKENGINFKWYVIGEGADRGSLEKLIKENNVRDNFVLLGYSENPYPYIKQCDLYIQTSRYEGFCLTLSEARILNKPIVTTNFFGANEQIINGKTGSIVNFNEEDIYCEMKKLLNDTKLRRSYKENLEKEAYSTMSEMNKFYILLGEETRK